ncbi:helix-hairpin-helix domain-containing protein [Mycoplasmopsis arginini]|uniref:helix-hairpin-helix domain-containing protein n=1 Tax=Mycoplasmopsis arginini TaxID=2094 RepID=UPI00249DE36E|nr:Tex-like N-terminal domain-containing protein [Mycoplasmopsis arginini]MDI3348656.1 helix-hairpin-helix domain-containing protein [Mycoplasmopsis arginini]MDI3351131.1 helix-hairpin-helix domain-containing protein [Mycoplasmopsis arginini]MDI3351684.1 helix-hairpin-helix domain-containing protein [Mycoplasmopsis arginini]
MVDLSIKNVAKKLNIKDEQVKETLTLLSEGTTIPFISRYRKEVTGGLDEEQVAQISELYEYDVELLKRKDYVKKVLDEKKLLDPEISKKIDLAQTKQEVENIYEPFKVGKKTKATEALALGLGALADLIMSSKEENFNVYREANKYVNGDTLKDTEQVIEQTKFIIAQNISQDISVREYVKSQLFNYGSIVTKKKNTEDEKETFKQYYDYSERVKIIPNHRVLAITRGEDKKILSYTIEFNEKVIIYYLNNKFFINKRTAKIVNEAIKDALDRLIFPSIIREIKTDLFERAEKEAIEIFAQNLEDLLLSPATKNKSILSIDPGYTNGCKCAMLDGNGNYLEGFIIYPHGSSKEKFIEAVKKINQILNKYSVDLIVIGNGTASRETEEFVDKLLTLRREKNLNLETKFAIVSEVGASVYSASKIAQEEFPDLELEFRSAINIGRKFQDPLNELIKIDPKSLGVGQYQHDVNQKQLASKLSFKVDKAVNMVGVDLNTATKYILEYVSGLSKTIAQNIVDYRNENGSFKSRNELKKVKGLGPKAYEQSVGFLRIYDSKVFYDKTNIHPDLYDLADRVVKELSLDLKNIDKEVLLSTNKKELSQELGVSQYDIDLIIDSLLMPGKDIREDKTGFIVNDKILKFEDIQVGQEIIGQVQNITNFGVFAYIGLKENVLIHIKNMKKTDNHFINHPSELVSIGDNLNIKIIDIDRNNNKIQGKIIWK